MYKHSKQYGIINLKGELTIKSPADYSQKDIKEVAQIMEKLTIKQLRYRQEMNIQQIERAIKDRMNLRVKKGIRALQQMQLIIAFVIDKKTFG